MVFQGETHFMSWSVFKGVFLRMSVEFGWMVSLSERIKGKTQTTWLMVSLLCANIFRSIKTGLDFQKQEGKSTVAHHAEHFSISSIARMQTDLTWIFSWNCVLSKSIDCAWLMSTSAMASGSQREDNLLWCVVCYMPNHSGIDGV